MRCRGAAGSWSSGVGETRRQAFRSGAIDGRGVAHVLTAQGQDGGYAASERIVGTLNGREGTFVIQHSGLAEGDEQSTSGSVIAGSGTGRLTGLRGRATEMQHGVLTLEYTLPV